MFLRLQNRKSILWWHNWASFEASHSETHSVLMPLRFVILSHLLRKANFKLLCHSKSEWTDEVLLWMRPSMMNRTWFPNSHLVNGRAKFHTNQGTVTMDRDKWDKPLCKQDSRVAILMDGYSVWYFRQIVRAQGTGRKGAITCLTNGPMRPLEIKTMFKCKYKARSRSCWSQSTATRLTGNKQWWQAEARNVPETEFQPCVYLLMSR